MLIITYKYYNPFRCLMTVIEENMNREYTYIARY